MWKAQVTKDKPVQINLFGRLDKSFIMDLGCKPGEHPQKEQAIRAFQ